MIFLGCDPGQSGGICIMNDETGELTLHKMPVIEKEIDLQSLFAIFYQLPNEPVFCMLEKVSAMPGQGVSSMFKFGRSYGMVEAMIAANKIPYELVTPQRWQRTMHAGIEKKIPTKKRSKMAAMRLFPSQTFLATERSKKPHDGFMDAALLAEYARRIWSQDRV